MLKGRRVVQGVSVLDAAMRAAARAELGAGDVLWSDDPNVIAFAIVLEPDVPLRLAAQILPVTMCAVGDCVGVLAPPQVGLMFRWPATVLVNGARAGCVRLAVASCVADDVPDWMVAGVRLRLRHDDDGMEPGDLAGDVTALAEEGCGELTAAQLISSCSRHFLTWLNLWQDDGFRPVHQSWLDRAEGRHEPVVLSAAGSAEPVLVSGLDEDGNLLIKAADGHMRSLQLLDALTMLRDEA